MLTLAYQCSICSFNLLFKIKRSSRVYTPMAPVFLLVLSLFIYLSSRSVIQTGNRNDAFLKREKRLANTVAWILLILVLTYFPGLLFGGACFGCKRGNYNLSFRPYYVIFMQLDGVLNPLFNVSRIKKKAIVAWVIIWFSAHCWKMFCIKYSSNEHVQCLYDLLKQVIFFVVTVHKAGTRLPRFRQ